jgi:DNA processing protein
MLVNGGLVTEYMSGTNPDRQNFVQRNRIIAGLCDASIVVESAAKGGALITAELANDYNRDVFAFPGRIGDEYSAGCNMLIKSNKATLIESANDLMKCMNWDIAAPDKDKNIQVSLFPDLSDEEQEVVSLLRKYPDGVQVNELAILLNKPFSKVSSQMLEMEFKGLLKCLPGGIYKILK